MTDSIPTPNAVTLERLLATLAQYPPSSLFAVVNLASHTLLPFELGEASVRELGPFDGETVILVGLDLTDHDRDVAAKALEDAASDYPTMIRSMVSRESVADWLRERAQTLRTPTRTG